MNQSIPISTVFFDLGNTVVYFDGDWDVIIPRQHRVVAHTLMRLGYPLDESAFLIDFQHRAEEYFNQRVEDWLELTMEVVLRRCLLAQGIENPRQDHLKLALQQMYAISQAHWKLEKEAPSTLRQLMKMGLHLGAISNAADAADVHKILKDHKLDKLFELVLISAEEGIRKPNPAIFEKALRHFGIKPAEAVMVGDWLGADILGARNAGLRSVWITRRVQVREQTEMMGRVQPDATIENLSELPPLLAGWMA